MSCSCPVVLTSALPKPEEATEPQFLAAGPRQGCWMLRSADLKARRIHRDPERTHSLQASTLGRKASLCRATTKTTLSLTLPCPMRHFNLNNPSPEPLRALSPLPEAPKTPPSSDFERVSTRAPELEAVVDSFSSFNLVKTRLPVPLPVPTLPVQPRANRTVGTARTIFFSSCEQ